MVLDSLPDRPLSMNEKEQLAGQVREVTPLNGYFVPDDEPQFEALLMVTDESVYGLSYDEEAGWSCVYEAETPEGAFTGPYYTNDDYEREAIEAGFDALKRAQGELDEA
jgi:hypothetical protein